MFTDEQRIAVNNVVEKQRQDPLYKPTPEEQDIIDAVLQVGIDIPPPQENHEDTGK